MLNTDLKIIEFVRSEDALYNPKNKNYRSKKFRNKLWERLARELDKPISELKNKWKNIRDCQRITQIKNSEARKQGSTRYAKNKYSDQLEFLTPFFKPYKPRKNSHRRLFTKRKPKPSSSSSDFDDFTLETEVIEDSSHSAEDFNTGHEFSNNVTSNKIEDLITFEWVPTEEDTINSKNCYANLANSSNSTSVYNYEPSSRKVFIDNSVTSADLSRIMTQEQAVQKVEDEVTSFFHYASIATRGLSPESQQSVIFKVFETITEARRVAKPFELGAEITL